MKKWLFRIVILAFVNMQGQGSQSAHDSLKHYLSQSNYIKALQLLKPLGNRYLKGKDYYRFAKNIIQQSNIYSNLNDSEKALEVAFYGLHIVQTKNHKKAEILLLRQVGVIYNSRADYRSSSPKFHQAMKLARSIKNDSLVEVMYQSLFNDHVKLMSDSAFYYLKKTVELNKKIKTPQSLFRAYNNSFYYYYHHGDFERARKYLDSAIPMAALCNDKEIVKLSWNNLGGVYYRQGKFQLAKKAYQKVFEADPGDSLSRGASTLFYTYSGVLNELGEYRDAYSYSDRAYNIMDSCYSEEMTSAVHDVETRYRIQKIEDGQRIENKKKEDAQIRERRIFLILIAVSMLCLILLYFFYQNNRLKQKTRLSQIESETSQKLLSATLDARETERKQIASVLHDSISAMLSSAGLQLTAFSSQQGSNDEIAKARQILREAHDKVRDLSHELVPTLLAKFGLAYALEDLCEKFSTPELQLKYKDDGSVKRYDEDFETKVYFITSELLNNVIKHSGASKARLTLTADSDLHLSLKDNGKGFDTTKPDGFGLTQIKARISAMKGKVVVSSKPGAGTEIRITVPLR